MKRNFLNFIITVITLLFFSYTAHAADTFTLDPQHTYVLWHIKHLGFSSQAGKWYASGTLVLDKDSPQNSKVNATIQVADVITGIPELDKHIKGVSFFDVEHYPTASFVSDKVVLLSKDTAQVFGTLTLHGVAKPVVLDVKLNQAGNNPITNKMTVGFSATAQIKRSDFGMTAYQPALGDNVKLDIEAEATKS